MLSRFGEYIDRRLDLLIVAEGLNVPEFGRSLGFYLGTKIRDSFSYMLLNFGNLLYVILLVLPM